MRVSFFSTCLVDMFFPDIGVSAIRLLRRLDCQVDFPEGQTCCGQPAWNSGFREEAEKMAEAIIRAFAESEYVVAPSGSCAGMIRSVYPQLFEGRPELQAQARALAAKTYELSEFLVKILRVDLREQGAHFEGTVAYHTSCHMTRELGVREEPFQLLDQVEGVVRKDLERPDLCCGFGGTFSVKQPELSVAMADEKIADLDGTGAGYLVGADPACLMHLRGRLERLGKGQKVLHLAELLEMATRPARKEDRP
ncbi:MAG TPA: (Fe-S)-binding protein [Symbiobacteriaceae bacterium]|nr:(Fe-S)-binding protein [Symbiobacteriaceae bacterium]